MSNILLAEDNQRLAAMLQTFLESLGHRVFTAADGEAALAALHCTALDLLVLDLKLPVTSGIEVLKTVRRSRQLDRLPVVIITGVYRGDGYAQAAGKLGAAAYLEKPFTKDAFLDAVRSALEDPSPSQQFSELLARLHLKRQSGTLKLPCGSRVTFLHGEPASFRSGAFLPFLVSSGQLFARDLESYSHGSERLQLTRAGLLSYDELLDHSRTFLSKTLTDAIEKDLKASFVPELGEVELPLTPLSLPRLLHEASRAGRLEPAAFLKRHAGLYPAKTREYYRLANLFSMGREEIELLELVGRGGTIESVIANCPDPSKGASFLQFLLRMEMISLRHSPAPDEGADFPQKRLFNRPLEEAQPDSGEMSFEDLVDEVSESVEQVVGKEGMAAPLSPSDIKFEQEVQRDHAALQEKNYYEIFSLDRGSFSFQSLKEAYFSAIRHYTPEKFMQLSGATLTRAQDVLSHYANAYNTLSNVIAKERYDEMLDAAGVGGKRDDELQARIQFQSGKVFLEMGDFANAERALQEAYTLAPQDAQTCAYLAWSIYRNPSNSGSRAAQERSRTLLSKSLQLGRCAEAFAFRGSMLLDEGRDGLAEGEFQKALKLNPKEQLAIGGIRLISERRSAEKKGLFRRLFG